MLTRPADRRADALCHLRYRSPDAQDLSLYKLELSSDALSVGESAGRREGL